MTALDLLANPEVHEVQGIPHHRLELTEAMIKASFKGVIWVTSPQVLRVVAEEHKVIPNTTLKDLRAGDYGGVFLDDGYWIMCDAAAKQR
jgi:hypothetical protein